MGKKGCTRKIDPEESRQMGESEAEAIGLALQEQADWLLTDDAKARQFAESLGLEVNGSIAIILWAVAIGLICVKALCNSITG